MNFNFIASHNSKAAKTIFAALLFTFSGILTSCGDSEQPEDNSSNINTPSKRTEVPAADDGKGVGPIKNVEIPAEIDAAMAEKGKTVFEAKCTACHNETAARKVGPGMAGITERRKPEWIMNMILNPEKMVKEDPTARALLEEYLAPMANQGITEEEARQMLEYFRQNDKS